MKIALFDYGGVVGFDHVDPAERDLMKIFKASREEINSLLSEKSEQGRLFREGLISEKVFWDIVAKRKKVKPAVTPRKLTQLWMNTYENNIEILELIAKVRQKKCLVGILTNIDVARSRLLSVKIDIKNNFDFYLPSFRFNCSKDSSELWFKINSMLKEEKISDVFYCDDRIEHVNSANNVGWIGVRYIDPNNLKENIETFLGR